MSFWTQLRMPTERELLVGFYDLAGYMRHAEKTPPQDLLATMTGYFARTGQIVGDAGGRLIKTLGDAGLVAFPAEAADAGVLALRSVQSAGREWLGQRGFKTSIVVKLHRDRGDRPGRQPGRGDHRRLRQDGERRGRLAQQRARRHAGGVPQPAGRDPQALQEAHAADQLHRYG